MIFNVKPILHKLRPIYKYLHIQSLYCGLLNALIVLSDFSKELLINIILSSNPLTLAFMSFNSVFTIPTFLSSSLSLCSLRSSLFSLAEFTWSMFLHMTLRVSMMSCVVVGDVVEVDYVVGLVWVKYSQRTDFEAPGVHRGEPRNRRNIHYLEIINSILNNCRVYNN